MTDTADRAAQREAEFNGDALEAHHRHDPTAGKTVADSARECDGCGCQIPDARRAAVPGVRLCTECQEYANWIADAARRNGRRV